MECTSPKNLELLKSDSAAVKKFRDGWVGGWMYENLFKDCLQLQKYIGFNFKLLIEKCT